MLGAGGDSAARGGRGSAGVMAAVSARRQGPRAHHGPGANLGDCPGGCLC